MNLLQSTNPTIRTSTADFRWELTVASGSSRLAKGGKCTSVNGSEKEESDRCPRPASPLGKLAIDQKIQTVS